VNLGVIFGIAWAVAWPPLWAVIWRPAVRRLIPREPAGTFWGQWVNAAAWQTATYLLLGFWLPTAAAAVNLVFGVVMWWWSRRHKRRAPKAAGAKSRARVAALVRSFRESLKPRPALRPVPGGAS
jgi:ABC-type sulfate transport system permease component